MSKKRILEQLDESTCSKMYSIVEHKILKVWNLDLKIILQLQKVSKAAQKEHINVSQKKRKSILNP